MKNEYRYHPEITGLKVNQNGTQVIFEEKEQEVKVRKSGNHPFRFIYIKGHVLGIARLVLECWKGMPPIPKLTAKHIDGDYANYHYENLEWANVGGNSKFPPKLTPQLENEIMSKHRDGVSTCELAREYKVARNTIQRLIKRVNKREQ